jgi:hypothetical protein
MYRWKLGEEIEAKIPIREITISISIRVKPL